MFGIGWPEFIVILVLLIFVGPRQFPGLLQKIGQVVAQLRSASRELRNQLDPELTNLDSPRKMAQKYGRQMVDEWTSPYSEAMKEAELPRLDQIEPPEALVESANKPDEDPTRRVDDPASANGDANGSANEGVKTEVEEDNDEGR